MQITIHYDSVWRNSFLDGDNNSPIPKGGRNYIASSTSLKKAENRIERKITHNTVMGVLNRLIGDRRKLYQARNKEFGDYYFEGLEQSVHFEDKIAIEHQEVAFLRNRTLHNYDRSGFTGMLKGSDPILSSDYSELLWGVLALELAPLCDFIVNKTQVASRLNCDPLVIAQRMKDIEAIKPINDDHEEGLALKAVKVLEDIFPGTDYFNKKGQISVLALYCSALYLQLDRLWLQDGFDTSNAIPKGSSVIAGFAKRGFTYKDFINRFSTGKKKPIYGNPYVSTQLVKGQGKVNSSLTKANGTLVITLDMDKTKARELKTIIEDAGVATFYLGKKGLAFVHKISL